MRLRRRSEFLAAARGARLSRAAFVLQALPRPEPERAGTIGIGLFPAWFLRLAQHSVFGG